MPTLADSLASCSLRRLPLRMRPDLVARRQTYQGQCYWVIKEPVGLRYFRFEEEEYALLCMLDGQASLQGIKDQFEAQFAPQRITSEELQQLVGMLHRSGLLIADAPGQGDQLLERGNQRLRKERLDSITNVLAMRFKGIDPERLLRWLEPYTGWIFSRPAACAVTLLAVAAVMLVTVQLDAFRSRLPTFHEFFAADNWIWLATALAVTKILHEFGHGIACRRFGGECHEMGVMLLVLTPCLYCNVSDSWMLSNKWHRAAIGAAGMYVEVFLASLCTFLWWFSQPGLLHYMCLNVMFICSVSTVLFNGNPLLRYDGYYILSDLVEIPNLRQKSSSILARRAGLWLLGLQPPYDPFLPKRNQLFFILYAVAAAIYRWVVVLSILWFLQKVFQPYRLEILGQMIALAALYALVFRPLSKLFNFLNVPGRASSVQQSRALAATGIASVLLAAVLFIPLPSPIYCPLEIQPSGAETVYVQVPGRLEVIHVSHGQQVDPGDPLGRLQNFDLHVAIEELKGQQSEYRARLDSLKRRRHRNREAGREIAQVEETLRAVTDHLRQKEHDLTRLELKATAAGTILPPPEKPAPRDTSGQLSSWSGTPLDEKNLGAALPEGTLFCQIGDPRNLEANLVIDQGEIERIREGQSVEIILHQLPGQVYDCRISQVAAEDLKISPARLSSKAGGQLVSRTDAEGIERPMSAIYQAIAPIQDNEGVLRIGLSGEAKIHADWETLGKRMFRYLSRTFRMS